MIGLDTRSGVTVELLGVRTGVTKASLQSRALTPMATRSAAVAWPGWPPPRRPTLLDSSSRHSR